MPKKQPYPIRLDKDSFWEWMASPSNDTGAGIHRYIETIANYAAETGYMAEQFDEHHFGSSSGIMENLSLCMPHEYFLELQFCAKTYATLFGKVFPPLALHVDELAYIEWLLYVEPDYRPYRDHLVHMFKVAFAGDKLLSIPELLSEIVQKQFGSPHFREWCGTKNINVSEWQDDEKEDIIKIAFFMAALFHDFGYGHFFLTRYKGRLFKLYQWLLPGADPADVRSTATQALVESLPSHFIRKYHGWLRANDVSGASSRSIAAGFFRDCLPLNHSIASMFFVLDVADRLWRKGAITQKMLVSFQLAAEACMIHDMTGEGSWLHLQNQNDNKHQHFLCCKDHQDIPLAMLLIMADELSIWDRSSLEQQIEGHRVIYSLNTSKAAEAIKISVCTGAKKEMKIVASPPNAQSLLRKKLTDLTCLRNSPDRGAHFILDYRIILP